MAMMLLMALIALPQTNSIKKCPIECTCDLDASGRYSTICERGNRVLLELLIDFGIKRESLSLFASSSRRKHEADSNQGAG